MEKSNFEVFTESYKSVIKEGAFKMLEGNVTLGELIKNTKFKPFDETDRQGFAGVDHPDDAMIGEYGDYIIIIDGDLISVSGADAGGPEYLFRVVPTRN